MTDPLFEARAAKRRQLLEAGADPYPARVPSHTPVRVLLTRYAELDAESRSTERYTAVGRVTGARKMGKAAFFDLRDGTGKIQVHATVDGLGEDAFTGFLDTDIGDFLAVSGDVFRTKRGELSIGADAISFLAKALRPLPEKWHGLKDPELRHRHRSLDLIANDDIRDGFVQRSKMIAAIRRTLDEAGFLEVETPVLQPIPGGANARPFITHHNALDMDLYMRIALELYLKRLLIGGLDRVYEIGKCFRNEGVSTEHFPEFTMLEVYQAYTDYRGMMELAETLIPAGLMAARGSLTVEFKGASIDFTPPWPRRSMLELITQASGIDISNPSTDSIRRQADEKGIGLPGKHVAAWIDFLFETYVEPDLVQPTFIVDYPVALSPLAKRKADDERVVERFELFVAGMEIANAFSELNDPIDQRDRFLEQEQLRAAGDDEAQRVDEDFLFAMEHGMPPAGGMGIGIDRLAMLCTGQESIRDIILFPTLRRKDDE